MGWHATTAWDLEFISEQAKQDCFTNERIRELFDFDGLWVNGELLAPTIDDAASVIISSCGEEFDANAELWDALAQRFVPVPEGETNLQISGWSGGKCYFDDDKCNALAPFVKGSVEVTSGDDDSIVLYRFDGEGGWAGYHGEVVFPTDPEREKRKVWSCTVQSPHGMAASNTTLHDTEEACWESLRENYDPEGEADDEPPVAIVEALQNRGYFIDIDVHEI